MSLERIPQLVAALQADEHPAARELVRIVLELHRDAITSLIEQIGEGKLLARLAEDRRIAAVLLLYGLHPVSAQERVRRALAAIREVSVEEVRLADGELRVRVHCEREPLPGEKLREAIEQAALDAAPELGRVRVEGIPAVRAFIPIAVASAR